MLAGDEKRFRHRSPDSAQPGEHRHHSPGSTMLIVIELPYDAAQAVDRLRPLVAPPSRQRDLTSGERVPLVGKVGLDGVHVKANTIYRSSFAAEGHGVFTRVA